MVNSPGVVSVPAQDPGGIGEEKDGLPVRKKAVIEVRVLVTHASTWTTNTA